MEVLDVALPVWCCLSAQIRFSISLLSISTIHFHGCQYTNLSCGSRSTMRKKSCANLDGAKPPPSLHIFYKSDILYVAKDKNKQTENPYIFSFFLKVVNNSMNLSFFETYVYAWTSIKLADRNTEKKNLKIKLAVNSCSSQISDQWHLVTEHSVNFTNYYCIIFYQIHMFRIL